MKPTGSHVEDTLRVIGRKGTLTILEQLLSGPKRFTALEKILRVSPRTLSERLKELEDQNIIDRQSFAEVPPRVEYTLTAKGKSLTPLIDAVRVWSDNWDMPINLTETLHNEVRASA
jgi:DNA-binding HxlR family transcriptional regulator